ncbi:hypothetical protein CANCADRAFT_19614, partial [Tortispora caseinolytica NRRL Y-17796]
VVLEANQEWRFETQIQPQDVVSIKLLSGTAEIFGSELAQDATYTFSVAKLALFTYTGCEFQWTGSPASEYIGEETPVPVYLNLHLSLEKMRVSKGPTVLITGPKDTGKTSLAKTLTAYIVKRMGTNPGPIAVNLDPAAGFVSVPPGAVSAAHINGLLDPQSASGWGDANETGLAATHIPTRAPLSYYYGHDSVKASPACYENAITKLSESVNEKSKSLPAGVIIDTPHVKHGDYEMTETIVKLFKVDVIVVIGHERIYSDLRKRFADKFPSASVVRVPESGGVVEREDSYIRAVQQKQIREYFYGSPTASHVLNPFSTSLDLSKKVIYRVLEVEKTNKAAALSGLVEAIEDLSVLQNSVLALIQKESVEQPGESLNYPIMGFMHVSEVDESENRAKVLIPIRGQIPPGILLA